MKLTTLIITMLLAFPVFALSPEDPENPPTGIPLCGPLIIDGKTFNTDGLAYLKDNGNGTQTLVGSASNENNEICSIRDVTFGDPYGAHETLMPEVNKITMEIYEEAVKGNTTAIFQAITKHILIENQPTIKPGWESYLAYVIANDYKWLTATTARKIHMVISYHVIGLRDNAYTAYGSSDSATLDLNCPGLLYSGTLKQKPVVKGRSPAFMTHNFDGNTGNTSISLWIQSLNGEVVDSDFTYNCLPD